MRSFFHSYGKVITSAGKIHLEHNDNLQSLLLYYLGTVGCKSILNVLMHFLLKQKVQLYLYANKKERVFYILYFIKRKKPKQTMLHLVNIF